MPTKTPFWPELCKLLVVLALAAGYTWFVISRG
jgi:hypothetical protein